MRRAGSDDAAGGLLARMTISFGPITQAYTSHVVADPQALTITAKCFVKVPAINEGNLKDQRG